MKTAAFFFDTFLIKDKEKYYGMTLTNEFFLKKYLKYYNKIIVSTRCKNKEDEVGDISGYKQTNGRNVIVLPIESYKSILDSFLKKKKIEKEVENVLLQVDLAIIRMPSVIGSIACELCRKLGIKYKIEMVACPLDGYWNHQSWAGKIVAPYMFCKTKKNIKNAPEVLYVTNHFLQGRYPTKGLAYACSDVDLPEQDKKCFENRLCRYQKLNKGDIIKVYTIANVELKYKGHKYVIDSIKKNNLDRTAYFVYKYYLIGNGSNYSLKKYVKNNKMEHDVVFLGSMPHRQIFDELQKADLYIQPSLTEGLSRSVIEAMYSGLPIIVSNAGGNPELINDQMIFKKKDTRHLTKILKEMNIRKLEYYARQNFKNAEEYALCRMQKIRDKFYLG